MAQDRQQDIDLEITRFEYGDPTRPQRAVLTISTDKASSGGLLSSATVFWRHSHGRVHLFGAAGGGDFSKTLARTPRVRATQKVIDMQHAAVFTAEVVADLLVAAKAHYAEYLRAGVDGFHNTYPQPVAA